MVAKAIHKQSGRKRKLLAINCAAIPENLLESELFGHKEGAFTGASSNKVGLFEIGDKGTVLLNEVDKMPLPLQSKLLRVLEEKEIMPLGATVTKEMDVLFLAATNRDLAQEVEDEKFAPDLHQRLSAEIICDPQAVGNPRGWTGERVADAQGVRPGFSSRGVSRRGGQTEQRCQDDAAGDPPRYR